MNVLIISYYFKPFTGVGGKRTSYWYEKLLHKHNVSVLTAYKQEINNSNIKYINPSGSNVLLSKVIKDEGLNWLPKLKDFFKKNTVDFDIIIISGGPFMQMLITKFLKLNTSAKIILDFRDPFYANPRFNTNKIKDAIKLYFQNKFLAYTDIVITVNNYCANLIKFNDIRIIDNGYDDEIFNNINPKEVINNKIIAVGRIDEDFDISEFTTLLENDENFIFNYYGNNTAFFSNINSKHKISKPIEYKSVLEQISSSEICIIFTGGHPFESTTKIFDYLAFNKKILIVTEGDIKTGSLNDITKDYPNVYWTKNIKTNIEQQLKLIFNSEVKEFETSKYSRNYGFQKLLKIIEEK